MKANIKKLLALTAVMAMLLTAFAVTATAANSEASVSGAANKTAAAVMYSLADGKLTAGQIATVAVKGEVTESGAAGVYIEGTDYSDSIFKISSGEFTIGGKDDLYEESFEANVGETVTDSYNSVIKLNAATATGRAGAAASITGGSLYIDNAFIYAEGSQRYTVSASKGTMVINDSALVTRGVVDSTADKSEPGSNNGLLVNGRTRTNMSVGQSQTYYFNSYCVTDGWAAMSTDSAQGKGLDFYAYNSVGLARDGGYGTYADSNCRVWLYGSVVQGAELGAIISNNGEVHAYAGSAADESVLKYNKGETTEAGSQLIGGRNVVQIHSPDMMGGGSAFGKQAVFAVENSAIKTTKELVSTRDYYEHYGKAVGKYVDFISGACVLVKSHSADVDLVNTTVESYSNTIFMSVMNSDSMSRYLKAGETDTPTSFTMTGMTVSGDVKNYDYQRDLNVELVSTTWTGVVDTWNADKWNAYWADCKDDEDCYWLLDSTKYSQTSSGTAVKVGKDSKWIVSGDSVLNSLTVEAGGAIESADGSPLHFFVNGKEAELTDGQLTGAILITTNAAPAELPMKYVSFTDVEKSAWYAEYVISLAQQGVINGFDDGSYRPNDTVTYGQALKLICLAAGMPEMPATDEHWAGGYLKLTASAGILDADTDLNAQCPRSVVADVAAAMLGLESKSASPFADTKSNSAAALYEAGIIDGYVDGATRTFKPDAGVKRSEMAKIVCAMTEAAPTESDDVMSELGQYLPDNVMALLGSKEIQTAFTQFYTEAMDVASKLTEAEAAAMLKGEVPQAMVDVINSYIDKVMATFPTEVTSLLNVDEVRSMALEAFKSGMMSSLEQAK